MAEPERVNRETRMRLPLKVESGRPSESEEKKDGAKTPGSMAVEVMQVLKDNIQLEGAARASRAYSTAEEKPPREERSAVRPFEELVEVGKMFGVNYGEMMAQKSEELRAMRTAADARDKELHELRFKELTQMEERIKETAARAAGDGGRKGLGGFLGRDGLEPTVKQRIEERVFGLVQPGGADSREPKQPAPFTSEWFKEWGELKPGMEAFARMIGFIPKEDAQSKEPSSLVTMSDMATGKIPIALALGLREQELKADLERLRIEREHERELKRTEVLGDIGNTLKANVPDAIAALRDMAGQHNLAAAFGGTGNSARTVEEPTQAIQPRGIRCSECGQEFAVEEGVEQYSCPGCGADLGMPAEQPEEGALPMV
ncbi:MAG: hypothetical protein ABIH46_05645 [Chloroflexota bacterium]